jgi:RNA polymerase sigma factor (sigma-70 family)
MSRMASSEDGIEKLVGDFSAFLVSRLNTLGCQRYGIDRDDLLQEIHIRLWKACTNGHGDVRNVKAYLRKIVQSVFINEINRINRESRALEWGAAYLAPRGGGNGHDPAKDQALAGILVDSLGRLKSSKQQVIRLRLEGFSFDEIARLHNWSYRKTCNMFYRGLKDLKRELGERGIAYED